MNLSPRLKTIASFVNSNTTVADIGTDHGYIPVYLVENKISSKVIATDINEGPLNSAKSIVTEKGLSNYIHTRLGNGLSVLDIGEVDTVIIAGMGGKLITEILDKSSHIANSINYFIFQPMIGSTILRRYIYKNGYKIIDEKLAFESGRIYEIIFAEHGNDNIEDEIFFEIGKKLLMNKDPLLPDYINERITKYEKVMDSLTNSNSEEANKKYRKYNNICKRLKEVFKIYESKKNNEVNR